MNKSLFLIAVALPVFLITSSMGFAQFTAPNLVGLYMTPGGVGAAGTMTVGAPVNIYLVLTRPEDGDGLPYSGINAFDCQMHFSPVGGIFKIEETIPSGGINSGDSDHIGDGFLEYIVEYSNEVPAIDDAVMIVAIQLINANVACVAVTLGPASDPSIPGEMSYSANSSQREIMYPSCIGSSELVFAFNNCICLPVEKNSFGSVKALYR